MIIIIKNNSFKSKKKPAENVITIENRVLETRQYVEKYRVKRTSEPRNDDLVKYPGLCDEGGGGGQV